MNTGLEVAKKARRRLQSLQRASHWCNSFIPQVELEHLILDDSIDGVPRIYRKVEIQYSNSEGKTLIRVHCLSVPLPSISSSFRFYNKTAYSGLETHIPNSYTTLILQVTYYSFPTRKLARSHITKRAMRARVCRAYTQRRTRNQLSIKQLVQDPWRSSSR